MKDKDYFEFKNFSDIDLYILSEISRNEDYKKLAHWIIKYKEEELSRQCEKEKEKIKDRYQMFLNNFFIQYKNYRLTLSEVLGLGNLAAARELSRTQATAIELIHISTDMANLLEHCDIDTSAIYRLINKSRFLRLKRIFSSVSPTISPQNQDPNTRYREKLESNPVFLLEELIQILKAEYDRRIIETKRRFEEYLVPHKSTIDSIETEINGIDRDLENLSNDTSINAKEKDKIRNAFLAKKVELQNILDTEFFKLKKIKFLSFCIRDGVIQFKDLIDSLQKKLDSFLTRQTYLEKLARINAKIPEFRSILDELYNTFQKDIESLQKGFLLFDKSFQETVLKAVEDQIVMSRIILSPSSLSEVEFEISGIIKGAESIPNKKVFEKIELD